MGSILSSLQYRTRIFFPAAPATLGIQNSTVSLRTLIEQKCPTLFADFRPPWWLFSGHLQTLYCVLGDFSKHDEVVYERKFIRLLDGGTVGLDFTSSKDATNETPIIVVMHGLTGGSYESYVRAILHPACKAIEDGGLGYRGVVVNFRGCAGVPVTSPQLYSAGHTDDLRQALLFITHLYPNAPLVGLGFSLGANVIVRYLAEEKEKSRLSAACVLGCPWDLKKNSEALRQSFMGRIYSRGMSRNLIRLLKKHVSALSRDPSHEVTRALAATLSLKSPTLEQFDNTFTRVAGGSPPVFPLSSSKEYYEWASSHYVLPEIRVPLLAINSADDPVVQKVPVDQGIHNPWTVIAVTNGGGHLGWFENGTDTQLTRWITKPVLEWLNLSVELHHGERKTLPKILDDDGFIKEEGRATLGCRLIDAAGSIEFTASQDPGLLQGL